MFVVTRCARRVLRTGHIAEERSERCPAVQQAQPGQERLHQGMKFDIDLILESNQTK
jgi:hypothetical protein